MWFSIARWMSLRVGLLLFLAFGLLLAGTTGWAQADGVGLVSTRFGLDGDAAGLRLDPDARFNPQHLLDLAKADDAVSLQALLTDSPSAYAVTRGLVLALLGEESVAFLRAYAFENGQPDSRLSGPELTALLNSPLPQADLLQLAVWKRLLDAPDLIGGGGVLEQRQFDLIALGNELRDAGVAVRARRDLIPALHAVVFLSAQRKAAFAPVWLSLKTGTTDQLLEGVSQLLTLVALDDDVDPTAKQALMLEELNVSVGNGFSSPQYGAIYVVLKVIPVALRSQLNRIDTLQTLSPNTSPTSDVAGLYTFRRIGLKISLSQEAMAGVLQHEIGHLAWGTTLTVQQRNRYAELHAQSQAGSLDFVSDYAQTNASEDYAEVFQAYMQDTGAWLSRSRRNDTLRQKLALAAVPLSPFAYQTLSGLAGPQLRRASVSFMGGLPELGGQVVWQVP